MSKLLFIAVFTAAAVVAVVPSCTKHVGLASLPKNKILEYKVKNIPDTVIYGAVDEAEHTITVYVPFYYGLTLIDPEITVSEGARLAGEVLPVAIDADKVSYTVKGPDSSSNVYTLKILLQGTPPLVLRWANASGPTAYPNSTLPTAGGNFYTRNMALSTWSLTNPSTGRVITLPKVSDNFLLFDSTYWTPGNIPVPADIDTGYYKVSVSFLGHKASLDVPVHIVFKQPTPGSFIGSRTAKQGDTISYNAFQSVFVDPTSVTVTLNGTVYGLPVVSYTRTVINLKVPDDLPAGEYENVRFRFSFAGWGVPITRGNLTINAK